MVKRGRYIVLEGGDAAGKGTQCNLLTRRLRKEGFRVRQLREPGGDAVGEVLRSILKAEPNDPVIKALFDGKRPPLTPVTELLLFNAARANMLAFAAEPILRRGTWIVADRSWLSTMAYQVWASKLDPDVGRTICQFAIEGHEPDLMVLLDIHIDEAEKRKGHRGTTDRFEERGPRYQNDLLIGYLLEARKADLPKVDAVGSFEEVHNRVWAHVAPLVKEWQSV